ncbi:MAG: sialidase, partial [Verrucomicrobium sp.]
TMVEKGRTLSELQTLMAPRPFLVSGGSEDYPARWRDLNRVRQVYNLLGVPNFVGMHNRPAHEPTEESNAVIYRFMEWALQGKDKEKPGTPK